jgi:hypothetical protein
VAAVSARPARIVPPASPCDTLAEARAIAEEFAGWTAGCGENGMWNARSGTLHAHGADPAELRDQIREQIRMAGRAARRAESIAALTGRRPEVPR